ncbi:MAG: hypothetical protein IPM98_08435 [Lewinellaceae bacterium]|nr:hypothetical protein [Lewinellaceae bacterium]
MSNRNSIEQFIKEHREAFDTATPNPQGWASVEKMLDRLHRSDGLEQFLILHSTEFSTADPATRVWTGVAQALDSHAGKPDDTLEAFIRSNRDAFDAQTPDQRVWAAIEQAAPAKGAKVVYVNWHRNLLRAAASIALLIAGINIGIWYAGSNGQAGMAMSDISTEYAELEQYYERDISTKKSKLTRFAAYSDKNVLDDLRQMDGMMNELRQELANVPPGNREQVVRAMIENYKAKAAILERVLQHLEQQQQPNQQQPATTNSGNYEVEKI